MVVFVSGTLMLHTYGLEGSEELRVRARTSRESKVHSSCETLLHTKLLFDRTTFKLLLHRLVMTSQKKHVV